MGSDIRRATRADNDAIATALASAFHDDPLFSWFFPDARTRLGKLHGFFAYCNPRMALPHDETWINAEGTTVAVWLPPDKWKAPVSEQIRVLSGFVRWAGRHTPRILSTMATMEKSHPHDPPSWYLFVLGTAAEHQGKGHGSAVMAPVLDRCDNEGIPAYLESSNPRNIPFYARHGFVERAPLELGPGRPAVIPMWREPR